MKIKTIKNFLFLAVVLFIITTILHLLSYFPSLIKFGFFASFFLVISVFPSFVAGIKSTQKYTAKSDPRLIWKKALRGTPTILKRLIWVVIAYCFFNFYYCIFYLNVGMTPEIVDGKYVLENSGQEVKEISEEEYYKQQANGFRAFSGQALLFQFISIAMLSSAYRLETKEVNE